MMKFIYVLWMIFLYCACLFAQGTFPLQIGNVWQYGDSFDSTYGWTERAVKDTILSNGLTYTMIKADGASYGPLYRQVGPKVYYYGRNPTSDTTYQYYEELYCDFSKTTGDTVRVTIQDNPPDTITVTVFDDRIKNVFGKMLRTWTFYETSRRTSGYSLNQIADSVGLIYTGGEAGVTISLLGAIINGIKYGKITGVENSSNFVPSTVSLYQNYPNPFNPTTIIKFKIQSEKHIALVVYNILGERIRNLFEGNISIGVHQIVWDGKNDFGSVVGTGIYFYRLKTDRFIETKKMILLR